MTTKGNTAVADGKPAFSLISNEKLLQLYSTMVKCRMLEERVRVLFRQRKFNGNYDAAVGQEATPVGVTIDLEPGDTVGPSPRDFIVNFIKCAPLSEMFQQLLARAASPVKGCSPRGGSVTRKLVMPSSTVAAQLNIATGVALANKMTKNGKIAVAFSGNGSLQLGVWHDALNFAGEHRLPIVYVSQASTRAEPAAPRLRRHVEAITDKAQACGIPGITVDGSDVVAVYRVAQESIVRARRGGGPTLIECRTSRWYGHSRASLSGRRNSKQADRADTNDPILNMEKYLTRKGIFSAEMNRKIVDRFSKELDTAIEIAESRRTPTA
jgi:pyruvate dehydrogenase E1 component alpha subunit